jgi:hypothetical protein
LHSHSIRDVKSTQRVNEVVAIAKLLLSEYRQGTPFHDLPQRDAEGYDDTTFVIEIDASGDTLRGLVATLDGVALAVDAAAVAVQYDQEIPGHAEREWNDDYLQRLASEPLVSLEIIELVNGSFKIRLKSLIRNPITRASVIALATVATVSLAIIFPPVGVPALVVTGIASVAEVGGVIQEQRDKEADRRRQDEVDKALRQRIDDQEKKISELRDTGKKTSQSLDDLKGQFTRLQEQYDDRKTPAADPSDIREAQIISIEVRVEEPPQAA